MKKALSALLALFIIASGTLVVGCAKESTSDQNNTTDSNAQTESNSDEAQEVQDGAGLPDASLEHPLVTMTIENYGDLEIELYPEVAPNTVNNFISLVESGYYDGIQFHRIINGFMIQGGDPEGTGGGGPGYAIKGEFSGNGFENNIKHVPGVLSMARTQNPDSAGSQFFLMHKASPHLDGAYAAFGQVITGLELVDEIAQVQTGIADRPNEPVVMEKVTVNLNGYEAEEPVKVE